MRGSVRERIAVTRELGLWIEMVVRRTATGIGWQRQQTVHLGRFLHFSPPEVPATLCRCKGHLLEPPSGLLFFQHFSPSSHFSENTYFAVLFFSTFLAYTLCREVCWRVVEEQRISAFVFGAQSPILLSTRLTLDHRY